MTLRSAARVLAILGWLAGMTLVLDGSLILGLGTVAVSVAAATALRLRGQHAWAWLKAHRPRRTAKTGSALERA
jgi:hypothetical protein